MKTTGYLLLLGIVCTTPSYSQTTPERDPDACTSIMVGKNATTDGSVITSHTCDSWYRTWDLTLFPQRTTKAQPQPAFMMEECILNL